MESEKAAAKLRRQLKAKKHQLQSVLSKPVFPKGFAGKYLDDTVMIDPAQNAEKAIEVMKKAMRFNPSKSEENGVAPTQKRRRPQKGRKRFRKA